MNNKEELGTGFIERACEAVGVTRGVYYNAKKNLKDGKVLSLDQINVLKQYDTIRKEAENNLQTIKKQKKR